MLNFVKYPLPLPGGGGGSSSTSPKQNTIVAFSSFSGLVWTENICCIFRVNHKENCFQFFFGVVLILKLTS